MLTQFKEPLKNGKAIKSKAKENESKEKRKWCVTTDTPVNFPDFDPYKKLLELNPKKKKKAQMQTRAFLDAYYPCSTKDPSKSSVMAISTHSRTMTEIYGSPKGNLTGNTDALRLLQKIGLLELVSNKIKYNQKNGKNESRTFRFNHKVAAYLDEKIGDIEPYKTSIQTDDLYEYYAHYLPKVGYNSIPLKGTHMQIDSVIWEILRKRYPVIPKTQKILSELNEFCADKPELLTTFSPNIRKTEHRVKKIGLRATNQMCNSKKTPEPGKRTSERKQIQKKYNMSHEYDINGSVPRITMSINGEKWLPKDETGDIYLLIYEELRQEIQRRLDAVNYVIGNNLTNGEGAHLAYTQAILTKFSKTIHNDTRQDVKYFFMRGYFAQSPQQMSSYIMNASDGSIPKAETDIMCDIFYAAIRNVIGETYGSAVFVYESAIMNLTALKLWKSGNPCGLVYDCFYTQKKVSDEDFENLIAESFNELKPYFKTDGGCFATPSTSSSAGAPLSAGAASPLGSLNSFGSINQNSDDFCNDIDSYCSNCGCTNSVENGVCKECGFEGDCCFYAFKSQDTHNNHIPLNTKMKYSEKILTQNMLKYPKLE